MMVNRSSWRALLCVVVLGLPVLPTWGLGQTDLPSAQERPLAWAEKLFSGPLTHDFGTVPHGAQLAHSFPMKNIYAVPVEITELKTTAGFVRARAGKTVLSPGERSTIEVSMDANRFTGSRTVKVLLRVGPNFISGGGLSVSANAVPKTGTATEQETKLRAPEATAKDLLAEIELLRKGAAPSPASADALMLKTYAVPPGSAEGVAKLFQNISKASPATRITAVSGDKVLVYARARDHADIARRFLPLDDAPRPAAAKDVALSRTTYTLPGGKAAALSGFLREHAKAAVLETKVEGERLTVTTTPAAQQAIGRMVLLMQGKLPAASPSPFAQPERVP